ncbi:hypothetical protein AR275_20150 [Stenotrophomonas maltophilia]|nr:hypothetical protein AR275_20150 [Stenotrophomonas maltophilia]
MVAWTASTAQFGDVGGRCGGGQVLGRLTATWSLLLMLKLFVTWVPPIWMCMSFLLWLGTCTPI